MVNSRTVSAMNSLMYTTVIVVADLLPAAFGALFGAMFASFYCVVFERVPKRKTLRGRSFCVCGRQLTVFENIPIAGWLATQGTAHCCGAKIPSSYFRSELVGLFIGGLVAYFAGLFAALVIIVITGCVTYFVALRRPNESGPDVSTNDACTGGR
jgi:prepilin signal peptidase PulO-like enzyme (type II secretory pathway)